MPIKTFKGLIADGVVDIISLHTNNGSMGYRITKFNLITNNPGGANAEHVVKLFTVPQPLWGDTPADDNKIDFSNQELLGVGLATNAATGYTSFYNERIIFDNMIFNQDIYVCHHENHSSEAVNYYIELEQVKLDLNENTVATLTDIRNSS